jgi:thiol-disulfide isomerase/thioredoxin
VTTGARRGLLVAVAVVAVALLIMLQLASRHAGPPVGTPAPPVRDPRGGVDLATLKGRTVLVDFFASWCQPCAVLAAPAVSAVARAHPDLAVIGIALESAETRGDLRGFLAEHGVTWPVVVPDEGFDSAVVAAWGVRGLPALFLVAPDGTIAASDLVGVSADATRANLERALAALAARR